MREGLSTCRRSRRMGKKTHTQLDPTPSMTNNTKIDIISQLRPITPLTPN